MASSSPAPSGENDQPPPAISGSDACDVITSVGTTAGDSASDNTTGGDNTDDRTGVDITGGDNSGDKSIVGDNIGGISPAETAEAATTSGTKSPEATTPEASKRKRNESDNKTVMLRTKDNKFVEMEKEAAKLSEVLRRQIEEGFVGDAIPVDVKKKTLKRVRVYCHAHSRWASWPSEVVKQRMKQNFDNEFSQTLDFAKRFFMFQAAISLKIKGLVDLLGETLAAKTSGKSIDELLSMIKEDNEFTPEEEEQVLRDLDRIVL